MGYQVWDWVMEGHASRDFNAKTVIKSNLGCVRLFGRNGHNGILDFQVYLSKKVIGSRASGEEIPLK